MFFAASPRAEGWRAARVAEAGRACVCLWHVALPCNKQCQKEL
jgi:hypothetical protein